MALGRACWSLIVGGSLALVGCGAEERSTSLSAPTASAPTAGANDCWTAEQRLASEMGEGEMANRQYAQPPAMAIDPAKRYTATLETNKGTIEVELFPQEAPKAVNNFVCLARDGYYDGTPFHRVVKGFVIQGGDPTGTGSGSPGYRFEDEPVTREYEKCIVAMANSGPNTNGSQFFIVLADLRNQLPKNYTIFGRVTGGQEAVDAIAAVPTRPGPSGEQSQPTEEVTLERVTVQEADTDGLGWAYRIPPGEGRLALPAVTPSRREDGVTTSGGDCQLVADDFVLPQELEPEVLPRGEVAAIA